VLKDLQQLYFDFKEKADFLTIYIIEAHASDEWPLGKKKNLYSTTQNIG